MQRENEIKQRLLTLRKKKKLHSEVESKLAKLLKIALPELHSVSEIQGLPGGRNDLIAYDFLGKSVVFEIFASSTQVSRDLLILECTVAEKKIAVILDKNIDPKIYDTFLRQKPDLPYPHLFISELYENPPHQICLKLREIIAGDEEARFKRILRQRLKSIDFGKEFQKDGIQFLSKDDISSKKISYSSLFITLVLRKLISFGLARRNLITFGKWLSATETLEFLFLRLSLGFNIFLYTDLNENIAFYSDVELSDWIRAGDYFESPYIILSMNAMIREMESKYFKKLEYQLSREPGDNTMFLGMSQVHKTKEGRVVILSIPKDTIKIVILPPMEPKHTNEDYLNMIEFSDQIVKLNK